MAAVLVSAVAGLVSVAGNSLDEARRAIGVAATGKATTGVAAAMRVATAIRVATTGMVMGMAITGTGTDTLVTFAIV